MALLKALLKIAINNVHCIATSLNLSSSLRDTILKIVDYLAKTHSMRKGSNRPVYQVRTTGFGHFPKHEGKKNLVYNVKVKTKKVTLSIHVLSVMYIFVLHVGFNIMKNKFFSLGKKNLS